MQTNFTSRQYVSLVPKPWCPRPLADESSRLSRSSNYKSREELLSRSFRRPSSSHFITYNEMMKRLHRIANENPIGHQYEKKKLNIIKTKSASHQTLVSSKDDQKNYSNEISDSNQIQPRETSSNIEKQILQAKVPIPTNKTEEITVLGQTGIWLNQDEVTNGISNDLNINYDPNPEIITKIIDQPIEYNQDIQIRFLRPPTPPPPGDIIIKQDPIQSPPPIIIRQNSPAVEDPQEPLIIREMPPDPPTPILTQIITVCKDQKENLPTQKLIIERMPNLPPKPQKIIIEKWLPYKQLPRKVVYEHSEVSNIQKAFIIDCECKEKRKTYSGFIMNNKKCEISDYVVNDLDPRVQNAIDKMNQQIVELKNELDQEKAKSRVLAEKVDHMMIIFGCLLRV